ncbi:MAG: TIGR03546 family protein [Nitrospirae bacterium]|nr:MAG: TIGR03546 family protein [Nitrospirota bacterium]
MLRLVAKLLKALASEQRPAQLALAFALGMVAGLTPLAPHDLVVLFLVLVLRVNLASFLAGLALFSALALPLAPLLHRLGLALLTAPPLAGLWAALYNTLPGRLEGVDDTRVTGSLVAALAAFVPVHLVALSLVRRYRERLLVWVRRTRLAQLLKASKLWRAYQAVARLKGGGP